MLIISSVIPSFLISLFLPCLIFYLQRFLFLPLPFFIPLRTLIFFLFLFLSCFTLPSLISLLICAHTFPPLPKCFLNKMISTCLHHPLHASETCPLMRVLMGTLHASWWGTSVLISRKSQVNRFSLHLLSPSLPVWKKPTLLRLQSPPGPANNTAR